MEKDNMLRDFMHQHKKEISDRGFSKKIQADLQPRAPLNLWAFMFVVLMWMALGVWFYFSFDRIMGGLNILYLSLSGLTLPANNDWILFPGMIALIGFLSWQTIRILTQFYDLCNPLNK
ncbi:MAG: hypothetical protein RR202_07890 [Bacteroidales bacterium]